MDKTIPATPAKPNTKDYNFEEDTVIVAEEAVRFIEKIHPAYLVNSKQQVLSLSLPESDNILDAFSFYKLDCCTIEYTDDIDEVNKKLNEKMTKFYSSMSTFNMPVIFGICACKGVTNLVIGFLDNKEQRNTVKSILEGSLNDCEFTPFQPDFAKRERDKLHAGYLSAIPSVTIDGEKQRFNLATVMKSLNGKDYNVFFIARPVSRETVNTTYKQLIDIRDNCFAVSKRNISHQEGFSHSKADTTGGSYSYSRGVSETSSWNAGWSFIVTATKSGSETVSENETFSKNFSKTVSDTVNKNEGISHDIQNGLALELMEYADKGIERLRQGINNGMWETVISFSSNTKETVEIIRSCIAGELAKPNPDVLPFVSGIYELDEKEAKNNSLIVPRVLIYPEERPESSICTVLTTEELGLMCSLPVEPVPDFELKRGKVYPLVSEYLKGVKIGCLCEGKRTIKHMPFSFTLGDLVKHTFVCGITGSGKTTTVKRILTEANVPFLVVESAKKEYRNIKLADGRAPIVFTLGKPEINCLRVNPFYVQRGVSLQMHIDFLKDLFNASFSFYGPMPYILEKCLHTIYQKKGWNLTLGCHSYLVNRNNAADLFEDTYVKECYNKISHKYLYPTMQDLKDEIKRYIEQELQYDGEVAGNIKTAILARLENLCTGAKGYMFNTNDCVDMESLLSEKVVFELEGLADDSDKAFCIGLIAIFINEYRQSTKSNNDPDKPLVHLLVIEEAHRLLKNIETERSTEEMGNPKGKAVEHFTNMIAEMRSYGQGVIIAEQIPTKLAPDVIKNSSNKIIQRLVASDDQMVMANTIGLNEKEAIYIGNLTTGMGLCHKAGMNLPVQVKIDRVEENIVSDDTLYNKDLEKRFQDINYSIVKECLGKDISSYALKIINSILIQDYEHVEKSVAWLRNKFNSMLKQNDITLMFCNNENAIYAELLSERIAKYLLHGVYSIKDLVEDNLFESIKEFLKSPTHKKLDRLKLLLKEAYMEEPRWKGQYIIRQMIYNQMDEDSNIRGTIKNYFIVSDDKNVDEIKNKMEI